MLKKKDRRQQKELWPGAQFWLDCAKIKAKDFDKVERWLKEFGDPKEQLTNLLILKEHVGYECDKIARQIRAAERETAHLQRTESDYGSRRYIERAQAFGARLARKIEQLRNLKLIQGEPSGGPASVEPDPHPSEKNRRTIPRAVWAFHFLLLEAGMSYATVDKTTVARFVSTLTGFGYDNVYARVNNKHGKNEKATLQDLTVVREWFESLGLSEITNKIDAERNMVAPQG